MKSKDLHPECRAGKHDNCDEWTLDADDQEVPCECACHQKDGSDGNKG